MSIPIIFDRKLYAARRYRAEWAEGGSFLVRHAGENLAERLSAFGRNFARGLDLSSRNESFALLRPCAERWVRASLQSFGGPVSLVADEEALPFAPNSFDLIVSILSLHAVNDLPGALMQIRHALTPGGLFLATLFGGETLGELRRAFVTGEAEQTGRASPRIAPFADIRDMGSLMQRAGFSDPVTDLDRIAVRYSSFSTLASDLRTLGETNSLAARSRFPLRRDVLRAALAHLSLHSDDAEGKFTITFDLLGLTGWSAAPRPSTK